MSTEELNNYFEVAKAVALDAGKVSIVVRTHFT
jgi:hypothetical protein